MESLDFIEMMVAFAKSYPHAFITSIDVWDRTIIQIQYNYGQWATPTSVKYNADLHLFFN